jgi:tetratricopeptide (TPR) repeat protein
MSSPRPCRPLAVAAIVVLTAHSAPGSDFVRAWPPAAVALEKALASGDTAGVRQVRDLLAASLESRLPAGQEALARYALAYVNWRLVQLPGAAREQRVALLDEAVIQLHQAIALDPDSAEAHALVGSVHGLQVGLSPEKGMILGPPATKAVQRATQLEPANPRVVLVAGVSAYHTPPEFGGSLDRAETLLRRSIELFALEPADRPWPNWGRFDAHVWLGQLRARRGDAKRARLEYEKALTYAPQSRWVREVLLPRLEKEQPKLR